MLLVDVIWFTLKSVENQDYMWVLLTAIKLSLFVHQSIEMLFSVKLGILFQLFHKLSNEKLQVWI